MMPHLEVTNTFYAEAHCQPDHDADLDALVEAVRILRAARTVPIMRASYRLLSAHEGHPVADYLLHEAYEEVVRRWKRAA